MGKPRHLMTPDERARADAYQEAYREKNAEKLRAYRHSAEVKARRDETTRAWRAANPDKVRSAERARYQRDPTRKRQSSAAYRRTNPEAVKAALLEWIAANPEKRREYNRNAKAKRKAAPGVHTSADITSLQRLQKGKCAACRRPLAAFHVDHIVALARGGTNDRVNLQLLCPTCNLQKGAKHPVDFMQQKGFLL